MSFWQFTQVIGSPPQRDFIGVLDYSYANGVEKVSSGNILRPLGSILQKPLHRRRNVARLGKDHILQLGLVGAEGIRRRDAPARGVHILEAFAANARPHLRALAPAQHVLVSHNDPRPSSYRTRHTPPI